MEDREKRKIIAEEKHKEWVQKKNEQVRRKKGTHIFSSVVFILLLLVITYAFLVFSWILPFLT